MTLINPVSRELYEGDDVNVDFSYSFRILDSSHLTVFIADENDENKTELVEATDYEVYGVGEEGGGWITTLDLTPQTGQAILPSGWKLSINRVVPLLQETDIRNQGAFYPSTHEKVFDYLTMQTQQLRDDLYRCPKTSTTSGLSGDLYLDEIENYWAETRDYRNETEAFRDETEAFRDETEGLVDSVRVNHHYGATVEKQDTVTVPFILPLDLQQTACFVGLDKIPATYLSRLSDYELRFLSPYAADLVAGASYTVRGVPLDVGIIPDPIVPPVGVRSYPEGIRIFGNDSSLRYSGVSFPIIQTATIRMQFELGVVTSPVVLFEINGSQTLDITANKVILYYDPTSPNHYTSLEFRDSAGVLLYSGTIASFEYVPGTLYEIELAWDLASRFLYFINGVKYADIPTSAGVRTSIAAGVFILGSTFNPPSYTDMFVDSLQVFDTVQHTEAYTPEPDKILWYPPGLPLEVHSSFFDPSAVAEAIAAAGFADQRAADAEDAEFNAEAARDVAIAKADEATGAASTATTAASTATGAASTATTKAGEAAGSATTASTAASTATTKASEAAGSATTATNKASEAVAAAATATTKASEAIGSAGVAAGAAGVAIGASTTATNKANEAAGSATAAATSEYNAGQSEIRAAASETEAANSAAAAEAAAMSGMYANVYDHDANYTIQESDNGALLRVDTGTDDIIMSLPLISTLIGPLDYRVAVVKWSPDANRVLVRPSYPPDTINGSSDDFILDVQYKSAVFVADKATSQWAAITGHPALGNVIVQRFSGAPLQVLFTLDNDPGSLENTRIFVDGIYQQKNTYAVSGKDIIFDTAPATGTDNIEVFFGSIIAIGTPSDGSISTIKLQDLAVTTPKINNLAVTAAKLAPFSVSTGSIQDLAVTEGKLGDLAVTTNKIDGLSITTDKIANSAVTGSKMAPNSVSTQQLLDLSVTTAKINDLAVIESKLQDLSVSNSKIQALAISEGQLQDGSIGENKLQTSSVSTSKLQDLAVTTAKLDSLSVTTSKLGSLAVTPNKLDDLAVTEAKLGDLSVATGKIQDSAVTEAKLGALSVSTGKIQDQAVTTVKIQDEAINAGKIAQAAVTFSKLAANSVTRVKIDNGAVDNTKITQYGVYTVNIALGAVTEDRLGDLSVATGKIQDSAVTADKLAPLSVPTGSIQDLAVTEAKLGDLSVATGKIQDSAVTADKLAPLSVITTKINNGAVTNVKLDDLAVTEAKLGALSVATGKIQDLAVTNAKIDTVGVSKIRTPSSSLSPLVNSATGTVAVNDGIVISNPDKIVTLPYQSFCRAYMSAGQLFNEDPAPVAYNIEVNDIQGEYNPTIYSFVPKVTGVYQIHGAVQFLNMTTPGFFVMNITVNDTPVATKNHSFYTTAVTPISYVLETSTTTFLTASNIIQIRVAAAPSRTSTPNSATSYFTACKIA